MLCGFSVRFASASSWKTLQQPHFYFHYQLKDTGIAQTLAAQADEIYQTITDDIAYAPKRKIAVYLCPTPECFAQKQPGSRKLPAWAGCSR